MAQWLFIYLSAINSGALFGKVICTETEVKMYSFILSVIRTNECFNFRQMSIQTEK